MVGKDNRAPADNAPDAADRDVDSLPNSRPFKGGNETTTLAREKNMVVSTVKTNCGSKYTWNQVTPVWIGKDIVNRFQVYPYMCIYIDHIYIYIDVDEYMIYVLYS